MVRNFPRITRVVFGLRSLWIGIGVFLLWVVVIEAFSLVLVKSKESLFPPVDRRVLSDAVTGVPWVDEYFEEIDQSWWVEWSPYVYWRRTPFRGKHINIGENGLRYTENGPSVRTARNVVEIFMFGGSTLWGHGARDEFTIPSYLSRLLREKAELDVEVTNFGEGGYVSTQEVVALLIELRNHNVPDIVIFYDGINDVFSAVQTGEAGIPQNEFNREIEFGMLSNPEKRSVLYAGSLLTFLRNLNTYRVFSSLFRRLQGGGQGEGPHLPETGPDEVVDVYASNVRIIESLAQDFGFEVLFYWQPVLFTKNELSASERELQKNSAAYENFYLEVYKKQRSFPYLREKHNFHDISLIFSNDPEPYFIDFIHVNEKANGKIAERMLKDVLPIVVSQTDP